MSKKTYYVKRKKFNEPLNPAPSIAEEFAESAQRLKNIKKNELKKLRKTQKDIEDAMPEGCFKFIWNVFKKIFK